MTLGRTLNRRIICRYAEAYLEKPADSSKRCVTTLARQQHDDFTSQRASEPAVVASNRIFSRNYGNLGKDWLPVRNQYTKYRITKPWTADSTYDDIFLAEPSKEDFYPISKEMPVFLKFLNLLTTAQNRKEAFIDFVKRCENGLVVEKDVYITKDELIQCMWTNGYSESEINAFRFAFPNDYKFHYPELSVLFEIDEEDCYKYCIKERASNPEELVELKLKKPTNLVSSYGLVFVGCWFGLSNAVLGNAWFFAKTLPFGAVFYMLAAYFQKWVKEYMWKEENALIEKVKQEKDYCETAIYNQLKKYLEDSKCNEYVENFKSEVIKRMDEYRRALLLKMKVDATKMMNDKLSSIALQENAIANSLERNIVTEMVKLFTQVFATSDKMKDDAVLSAIDEIKGDYHKEKDPLYKFFFDSLGEFQKKKSTNAIVKRCNDVFDKKEKEFLDMYTIRPNEYDEVSSLAKLCKSESGFDLEKLDSQQFDRLNTLFDSFNERMGYFVPALPEVAGAYPDPFVDQQV
ncbi:conserved hypothetical protein [Theileria equi strain WA]|uniref:Uncharacterized protein n=1 Tax=Theileria equi strain WA TaxID=1537102 RepID=L1LFU9_THEEQ|nr:conserved hypothetical protein [Theileria equi strain WA]EKX74140.1 conserved hypothetical protein [Theileria equi strain WA]|eukprot:XP_004833592.1 conserved hypothetical protein [Theileria equi strain WA]